MLKRTIQASALLILMASCRHKDLDFDIQLNTRIDVVFDWRNAPDANPESMGLYMYDVNNGAELKFSFFNKNGGELKIPFSKYIAICMNDDNTDWAYFSHEEDSEAFEVSTADAELLSESQLPTRSIPRARGTENERMASVPKMIWSDRVDSIDIPENTTRKTITLYPEELLCHYSVDIYGVKNIDDLSGERIDATLSGLSEGLMIGKKAAADVPATMPFLLTPMKESNSLHAEFLTFGETPHTELPHIMSIYIIDAEGNKWHYSADVTSQVHNAPDARNVHIVLNDIEFPKPLSHGSGFKPDVNEWQSVNITLKM